MKTYLECIPCFLRQALEASKLAGADERVQKAVLDEVSVLLPGFSLDVTPPEIARTVYGIVEKHLDGKDAYASIKKKSNSMAMELYPDLSALVEASGDPLVQALRLAVAGNVIDYGVPRSFDIEQEIEDSLKKDFAVFDIREFKEDLGNAESILYILDNAGEVVFDKLLISQMIRAGKNVICVVRGKPVINDVTMHDALEVGLDKMCRVISSGSDVPGTLVDSAGDGFREAYDKADIVISKGQGNFETLSGEERTIYFIFKAKCPIVASHVGCDVGDMILKRG